MKTMIYFLKKTALFLVISGIFGLVAARDIDLSKLPSNPSTLGSGTGIVLFSLTHSGTSFINFSYQEIRQGADTKPVLSFNVGRPLFSVNEDFSAVDGRWGRLIALQLPIGEYRFGPNTMTVVNGSAASLLNSGDLKIDFKVEGQKVQYLGNLDILPESAFEQNAGNIASILLIGVSSFGAASMPYITDQFERDAKVLKAANAGFDVSLIQKNVTRRDADIEIDNLRAQYQKRSSEGDFAAQAALTEARMFGYAKTHEGDIVRDTASLHFDKENYSRFLATGSPSSKTLFSIWSSANGVQSYVRTPPVLSDQQKELMRQSLASAYQTAAVNEFAKAATDPREQKIWEARSKATRELPFVQTARLRAKFGAEVAEKFENSNAKLKVAAVSYGGKTFYQEGEDVALRAKLLGDAKAQCLKDTGFACATYVHRRGAPISLCSIEEAASGWSNSYPPVSMPDTSTSKDKPWFAAYVAWEGTGAEGRVHPRSMVWDSELKKTFHSSGTCMSALRAVSLCKDAGGKQCELVLQDDKDVEQSTYAKDWAARAANYFKRP